MIKKNIINKGYGDVKVQNYFLVKKLKNIKKHFFKNSKDIKCKIVISKTLSKIKKNINYMKNIL